ncbi:MAG TPA: hypothetical protein VK708_22930 [Bryobacteraceae bacterium]|jgi:ElaB/YqjD/DUF883 family membrane-anchored ribosome-binding protein|nr:hypothetical protein [Bryobacteraceae bacterium]
MKVATLHKVPGMSWAKGVSWEDGQESAARLVKQARETGEDIFYRLNRHVRRHPWKAVGVALAAGALLGLVVSRNGRA